MARCLYHPGSCRLLLSTQFPICTTEPSLNKKRNLKMYWNPHNSSTQMLFFFFTYPVSIFLNHNKKIQLFNTQLEVTGLAVTNRLFKKNLVLRTTSVIIGWFHFFLSFAKTFHNYSCGFLKFFYIPIENKDHFVEGEEVPSEDAANVGLVPRTVCSNKLLHLTRVLWVLVAESKNHFAWEFFACVWTEISHGAVPELKYVYVFFIICEEEEEKNS